MQYTATCESLDINYTRQQFHKSMLHERISTNSKFDIAIDLIRRGIDVPQRLQEKLELILNMS
jgi:hypothetical protein